MPTITGTAPPRSRLCEYGGRGEACQPAQGAGGGPSRTAPALRSGSALGERPRAAGTRERKRAPDLLLTMTRRSPEFGWHG